MMYQTQMFKLKLLLFFRKEKLFLKKRYNSSQRMMLILHIVQAVNQLGDANEVLNERAVVVMARMSNKLTGRDFPTCSSMSTTSVQQAVDHSTLISGDSREVDHGLSVKLQVEKLIGQAMSHENLCQNYVGYVKVHSFSIPLHPLIYI